MLASLLGFAPACEVFNGPDMYGSPPVDGDRIFFRVQGTVTDDRGVPIPNIEVSNRHGNTTRTAHNGSFDFSGSNFSFKTDLVFIDDDGLDNGGQFEKVIFPIEFTEADRTGEDSFEQADLTFTLYRELEEQE